MIGTATFTKGFCVSEKRLDQVLLMAAAITSARALVGVNVIVVIIYEYRFAAAEQHGEHVVAKLSTTGVQHCEGRPGQCERTCSTGAERGASKTKGTEVDEEDRVQGARVGAVQPQTGELPCVTIDWEPSKRAQV